MNWLKKELIIKSMLGFAFFLLTACGVKGDPLPPEKPADLGRGRPTYKRATEEILKQKTKPLTPSPDEDKDENEDEN